MDSHSDSDPHTNLYANSHSDPYTDCHADPHLNLDPHNDSDAYPHPYAHADTYTDSHSNLYSHPYSNLDPLSDSDPHPNPYAHADPHADCHANGNAFASDHFPALGLSSLKPDSFNLRRTSVIDVWHVDTSQQNRNHHETHSSQDTFLLDCDSHSRLVHYRSYRHGG